MAKKILITLGVILVLIFIILGYVIYNTKKKIDSGEMIKWEGRWYTKEQLEKKYPPQYYEAPAKNTPEEVYTAFRSALLADDKEKALEQMRPERREEYRKAFENKEKFDKWAKTLPESIENLTIKNNQAVYSWDKKDGYKHTIEFTKNQEGYWQIDII